MGSSLPYVILCSNLVRNSDTNHDDSQDEVIDTRLQKVTIEDVKDEDSDITPTSMINDDENKLIRDYSFNSNKSSEKASTKEETLDDDIKRETGSFSENDAESIEEPGSLIRVEKEDISEPHTESGTPSSERSERSSLSTSPSLSEDKFMALDLPITAAEMKLRISSRKKRDPRKDNRMDFNRKHQIIQSL